MKKKKKITLENLCIIADDRPCEDCLATKEPLRYLSPLLRKDIPFPDGDMITDLKDFGFVCAGDVLIKAKPSIATYTDGTPREWQSGKEIRIRHLEAMSTCKVIGW